MKVVRTGATVFAWMCSAVVLTACGKATEAVAEKAAQTAMEKAIEQGLAKDGTTAKVDMSSGGVKISATDDKGQVSTTEIGNAKVGEADIGLPFYPGAKQDAQSSSRMEDATRTITTTKLESGDSLEKVATFYRDKLKAQSDGKSMMDSSSADSVSLILSDSKSDNGTTVQIEKRDNGTEIMLMTSSTKPK
jgi:hypothetical protein